MCTGLRIGGTALVAAVLALGGCGGASGGTTDQVRTLALPICDVSGAEGVLTGLQAGIAGAGREFEALAHRRKTIPNREGATEPIPAGRNERQILRAMKVNVASIRVQLSKLEDCARNALLEAEGKHAPEPAMPRPPVPRTVVGHRLGSARVEPGGQLLPARPCGTFGRQGTTAVHIFSEPGSALAWRRANGSSSSTTPGSGRGTPARPRSGSGSETTSYGSSRTGAA